MATSTGKAARKQFGTRFAAKRSKSRTARRKLFGRSTAEAVQRYGGMSPEEVAEGFKHRGTCGQRGTGE